MITYKKFNKTRKYLVKYKMPKKKNLCWGFPHNAFLHFVQIKKMYTYKKLNKTRKYLIKYKMPKKKNLSKDLLSQWGFTFCTNRKIIIPIKNK